MLKATMRNGRLVLLGLSELNIQKLKEGKPILVNGGDVGIPGKEIVIMYGQTEQDIAKELEQLTGQNLSQH